MPVYQARTIGTYRARYLGCSERTLEDQDTGDEVVRWLWRFQEVLDPTSVGEIAKWTGTNPKSTQSNAYKMMFGVLGHAPQPGDDTEAHVGELYDVTYGPNSKGTLTITAVTPVRETGAQTAKRLNEAQEGSPSAPLPNMVEPTDDLPF